MKKYAIIVAAGSGTRMGGELPKQFLTIAGKPLLHYTIETFIGTFSDLQIILVVHPDHLDTARDIAGKIIETLSRNSDEFLNAEGKSIAVISGAATRSGSVRAGLSLVPEDAIVFVHDGVRCLLSKELIQRCYHDATEYGNAIPAVTSVDTVRIIGRNGSKQVDRKTVHLVQTPQTFQAGLLKKAYEKAGSATFTDDAAVAENAGVKIHLVEGERENIKITFPADLVLAEIILKKRMATS